MNRVHFLAFATCLLSAAYPAHAESDADAFFRGSAPDGSYDLDVAGPPPESHRMVPPIAIDGDEGVRQRALDILDIDELVNGFGVFSRRADGGDEQSDAPPEVERMLRERFRESPAPNSDQGNLLEFDPLAPEDKAIIGEDNRIRVRDNTTFPFRAFGLLSMKYGSSGSSCSGTLIGPRTVITAAHCVYDHDYPDKWADSIVFYPGANGQGNFPYRGYDYDTVTILRGFISNYKGYYGSVLDFDLAVIDLREAAGERVGWLGYGPLRGTGFFAYNVGYPGDKSYGTMWRDSCEVPFADILLRQYIHRCDTWAGSSGSSMYRFQENPENRIVHGINVAEVDFGDRNRNYNIGVPLNDEYFQWVHSLRR